MFAELIQKAEHSADFRATPKSEKLAPALILPRIPFPFQHGLLTWALGQLQGCMPRRHFWRQMPMCRIQNIVLFKVLLPRVLYCFLSSLSHIFIRFSQGTESEGIKYLLLRLPATVNSIMVLSLVCLSMFLCKWTHTQGQREPGKGKGFYLSPSTTGNHLLMVSRQHWWLEMQG